MPRVKDITGEIFFRLTVIERAGQNKYFKQLWLCSCSCGNTHIAEGTMLRRGRIKSCGCWIKDRLVKQNTTHGKCGSPEHNSWHSMKLRCLNRNDPAYWRYGGRGITVCERWRVSFENFLADMGPRPKGSSLDRIDNNSGYSPDNCRWATRSEQANNQRRSNFITHGGETRIASDWSRRLGGRSNLVAERLADGWTIEKSVTTLARPRSKNNANGKEVAHGLGI